MRRGRGDQSYDQQEPDGEYIRDGAPITTSHISQDSKRTSEISDIVHGDILADDVEEFDYGVAKRESELRDATNRNSFSQI